jgi:hypothetical protein
MIERERALDLGGRFRRRDHFPPLDLEEEAAPDERHDEMEEAVEDAEAEVVETPPSPPLSTKGSNMASSTAYARRSEWSLVTDCLKFGRAG